MSGEAQEIPVGWVVWYKAHMKDVTGLRVERKGRYPVIDYSLHGPGHHTLKKILPAVSKGAKYISKGPYFFYSDSKAGIILVIDYPANCAMIPIPFNG